MPVPQRRRLRLPGWDLHVRSRMARREMRAALPGTAARPGAPAAQAREADARAASLLRVPGSRCLSVSQTSVTNRMEVFELKWDIRLEKNRPGH